MKNPIPMPHQGGDLFVHVDRSRLALVQARNGVPRRILVLRRRAGAAPTFLERLNDAVASLAPDRIVRSGGDLLGDGQIAAEIRSLGARAEIPVLEIADLRLLARTLRHRLGCADDGGTCPPHAGPPVPPECVTGHLPDELGCRDLVITDRPSYGCTALAPT